MVRQKRYETIKDYLTITHGTLDQAIAELTQLKVENGDNYDGLYLDQYECYGDTEIRLRGERLETDEEMNERLSFAASQKQNRIDAARKLLKEAGEL